MDKILYEWVSYPENKPDKQGEYVVNRRGEIKKIVFSTTPNSPINEMWEGVVEWLKEVEPLNVEEWLSDLDTCTKNLLKSINK